MILDRLENAALYRPLGLRIAAALDWLCATDMAALADGRHELEGDRLVAIVQRYRTKPLPKARWEAHRRYLDVQYVVEGTERMGYAPLGDQSKVVEPYHEANDVAFYDVRGDLFEVPAGSFAVFGPQDIHAPGLVGGAPPVVREVLKVVVKCLVDHR